LLGAVEGVSFLVLLGIAMPLKYLAGLPQAVRVVGMAHGLLFVLYVGAAVHAAFTLRWPLSRTLLLLGAAVLPGGPFLVDGWLRKQEAAPAPGS
jgi:integral membrane protein